MEKIEEKARYWFENCNITFKKPTDMFKDGYTTRNDEVVKMIEDEIKYIDGQLMMIKQQMAMPKNWTSQKLFNKSLQLRASRETSTALLTKLKEDKK